ncbi:hypothetical protein CRX50_00765 [Escherichia coli]|uniref:hypothetical protein n=1 Tax=Escherichia coli TaxID=562 RepID=UPI000BFDFB79|nr:hypothetical protein [Escherichia coli]PHG84868.1 hypothetical protein CRX50_00765 [Escherichia coli]HEC3218081.1 hypothetical protein [Escherichia coli]HEC3221112.1 hypothetical protein [Escherichia coli]
MRIKGYTNNDFFEKMAFSGLDRTQNIGALQMHCVSKNDFLLLKIITLMILWLRPDNERTLYNKA